MKITKFQKKKNKYEALGFVETMIAIMVVGISSVVLMQIAVNTMQNILQNEAIDNMTQFAIEGVEITQDIANRNEPDIFPPVDQYTGECFALEYQDNLPYFKKEDDGSFTKYTKTLQRNDYKNEAILEDDDELFRVICLQIPQGAIIGNLTFVVAEVVVGQRYSDGAVSKGNLAKDYEYTTVIKL